jgi:hypothetical protein
VQLRERTLACATFVSQRASTDSVRRWRVTSVGPVMHALSLVIATVVVGGCRSAPRPVDAAEDPVAPVAIGPCRENAGPLPVSAPRFAADGTITLTVAPEVPIADEAVHDIVRGNEIHGSTVTTFSETGQLANAPPPACVYTIVTPAQTCLAAPTGRSWASREGHAPYGTRETMRYAWYLVYELRTDACVTDERELAVLVAGRHSAMRVVRFGFDVSYTSAGTGGAETSYDGSDLRPTIAAWPADEQARYRRGPGFAASPSTTPDGETITRELTWFMTLDAAGQQWSTRLRDRSGRILLELPRDATPPILREGDELFWEGGRL